MKPRRCCVHNKGTPRCKEPYFATLKVRVVHPGTFRKTSQQWHFCQIHFNQFIKDDGKGWSRWYSGHKRAEAPVIGYSISSTFL